MKTVIGIDFGTTYTSMSYLQRDGDPQRMRVDDARGAIDELLLRTAVWFPAKWPNDQGLLVGHSARLEAPNGGRLLQDFKPLLARPMDRKVTAFRSQAHPPQWYFDPQQEAMMTRDVAYRIHVDLDSEPIAHQEHRFRSSDLSAAVEAVFRHLKEKAYQHHRVVSPDLLVVGVPAQAEPRMRHRLIEGILNSGWVDDPRQVRFLTEPLAIAIRYGIELVHGRRVLVFDYGGGTLDVTIADIIVRDGHVSIAPLLSRQLPGAGMMFDWALLKGPVTQKDPQWLQRNGLRVPEDILRRLEGPGLLDRVERAKHLLSVKNRARVQFPPYGLDVVITRQEFEAAIAPFLESADKMLNSMLNDLKLKPNDIDDVLLAGGSAQIPAVRDLVAKRFGNRVLDRYVGSGTGTDGFAIAGQRPEVIQPILETSYFLWDPEQSDFVALAQEGTPLRDLRKMAAKLKVEYRGSPRLIVFQRRNDEHVPVAGIPLPNAEEAKVAELQLQVDDDDDQLNLVLHVETETSVQRLPFLDWNPSFLSESLRYIRPGSVVRFSANKRPGNPSEGVGVVNKIRVLRHGTPIDVIAGDVGAFILYISDPEQECEFTVWPVEGTLEVAVLEVEGNRPLTIASKLDRLPYRPLPPPEGDYAVIAEQSSTAVSPGSTREPVSGESLPRAKVL